MKLLIIILIMSFNVIAKCGNSSKNFCNVKVLSVYDGDTFFVHIPKVHPLFGERLGVRVFGIDTPELRGGSNYEKAMAKKAKEFTKDMLDNAKKVDLNDCVKGKYFRIVCSIKCDDKDLGQELIKNKLAVPYNEK